MTKAKMKQLDYLRKVCLALPEVTEEPHFEKGRMISGTAVKFEEGISR
jgi:hypothetical protein